MNVQKAIFCHSRLVQPGQKINPFGVKEMTGIRSSVLINNNKKPFHVTSQVKYPLAKNLPLPNNIEAIMSVEIGQFSPERSRDISGPVIFSKSQNIQESRPVFSRSFNQFLESYDCKGAVSLNSSMQSNVPMPYKSKGNAMYLNMPGGQWEQGSKIISEDMQKKMYYVRIDKKKGIQMFHTLSNQIPNSSSSIILRRFESNKPAETYSTRERMKRAVAEYGSIIIVFHIGISLISLGVCYTFVSSGLDVEQFISYIPWLDSNSKITKSTGTFVTAYAIHKLFSPVRIAITLTSVPFIVRYLRKIGLVKPSR